MTDLDEALGTFAPPDDDWPPPLEVEPKPCRHRRDQRYPTPDGWECRGCGHTVSRTAIRRGKNARKRGLNLQLQAARDLHLVNLQGNGATDARTESMYGNAAFVAQMKSGGLFPGWMQRELDYLPRGQGRTPILVVIETPGPGRKARRLVVMGLEDFRELHVGEPE